MDSSTRRSYSQPSSSVNTVAKRWVAWGVKDQHFLALALGGEVGELQNLIKKEWRDQSDRQPEVAEELADVRIYLELLAQARGVDLDAACSEKLVELYRRWPAVTPLGTIQL